MPADSKITDILGNVGARCTDYIACNIVSDIPVLPSLGPFKTIFFEGEIALHVCHLCQMKLINLRHGVMNRGNKSQNQEHNIYLASFVPKRRINLFKFANKGIFQLQSLCNEPSCKPVRGFLPVSNQALIQFAASLIRHLQLLPLNSAGQCLKTLKKLWEGRSRPGWPAGLSLNVNQSRWVCTFPHDPRQLECDVTEFDVENKVNISLTCVTGATSLTVNVYLLQTQHICIQDFQLRNHLQGKIYEPWRLATVIKVLIRFASIKDWLGS